MSPVTISGAGCSLADLLYKDIDFEADRFLKFCSGSPGDGGLVPGQLVFADELERFAGRAIREILAEITAGTEPSSRNLGGPAIVALINAGQLLYDLSEVEISFVGAAGDDDNGQFILRTIGASPVNTDAYKIIHGDSPVTYVLSDPRYNNGQGERTFINEIGAAGQLDPEDLGDRFYESDILLFGGTALVPRLHDALDRLLRRGKIEGRTTVVNTVYDFRNEKRSPSQRWPLGSSDESYRFIDLLVADREEALRLSGCSSVDDAFDFFIRRGVGAVVVTNGPEPISYYSRGELFSACRGSLPVSAEVGKRVAHLVDHDTTGCGDNFAGAVLASMALQMSERGRTQLDLRSACALGTVCGGFACFYLGGTYHEAKPGEKREAIAPLYDSFCSQLGNDDPIIPFDRLFQGAWEDP